MNKSLLLEIILTLPILLVILLFWSLKTLVVGLVIYAIPLFFMRKLIQSRYKKWVFAFPVFWLVFPFILLIQLLRNIPAINSGEGSAFIALFAIIYTGYFIFLFILNTTVCIYLYMSKTK